MLEKFKSEGFFADIKKPTTEAADADNKQKSSMAQSNSTIASSTAIGSGVLSSQNRGSAQGSIIKSNNSGLLKQSPMKLEIINE